MKRGGLLTCLVATVPKTTTCKESPVLYRLSGLSMLSGESASSTFVMCTRPLLPFSRMTARWVVWMLVTVAVATRPVAGFELLRLRFSRFAAASAATAASDSCRIVLPPVQKIPCAIT